MKHFENVDLFAFEKPAAFQDKIILNFQIKTYYKLFLILLLLKRVTDINLFCQRLGFEYLSFYFEIKS